MTYQQQLYEVEAEIAAIQPEITKAKEKVEKAEEQLQKAIADKDPADIRADLKAIWQSATAQLTSLRQKEAMLMEWMFRIQDKIDDKDGGNHAGRLFEHTFRQSFIKAIYNDGKACRKYTNQTEPELMDQCRKQLKSIGWADKDTRFEDIQMDCVLRCYIDSGKSCEFADPAKILRPNNEEHSESPVPAFTRKISDSEMNEETTPNSSIVVELTANPANLVKKMMQLEKDLLFLLLRHQKMHKQSSEAIESIISYVVVVIPYRPMKKSQMDEKIQKEMLENKDKFPLLYRLYEFGRFVRYFTQSGMKAAVTKLSAHVAENSSVSRESSQLSLETKKIARLNETIILARNLSQTDPSWNDKVRLLEEKAKRMLISSEEDNDE